MSDTGEQTGHERSGEPLSSEEATRLWETYRAGANPLAIVALDKLYRALRKPLVEFCRLRGCDPELADEVSEQAWVRLLARKPTARRGFISLLRKTAQNFAYKAFQARHRTPPTDLKRTAPADPSVAVTQDETAHAVDDCLSRLSPDDRGFIVLVDVDGLSRAAACEILGWTLAASTCHERHLLIRQALADCLRAKKIF